MPEDFWAHPSRRALSRSQRYRCSRLPQSRSAKAFTARLPHGPCFGTGTSAALPAASFATVTPLPLRQSAARPPPPAPARREAPGRLEYQKSDTLASTVAGSEVSFRVKGRAFASLESLTSGAPPAPRAKAGQTDRTRTRPEAADPRIPDTGAAIQGTKGNFALFWAVSARQATSARPPPPSQTPHWGWFKLRRQEDPSFEPTSGCSIWPCGSAPSLWGGRAQTSPSPRNCTGSTFPCHRREHEGTTTSRRDSSSIGPSCGSSSARGATRARTPEALSLVTFASWAEEQNILQ